MADCKHNFNNKEICIVCGHDKADLLNWSKYNHEMQFELNCVSKTRLSRVEKQRRYDKG